MAQFNNKLTLGILGGGQLGKMLIQAAMNLDIRVYVMDPDTNAPCKPYCHEFTCGSITDFDSVYRFGKRVDLLTIEIENVNTQALERLQAEGLPVYPQPDVITTIQDKGAQKRFLKKHKIPTAEFELIENRQQLESLNTSFPLVQKLRKAGYDGRGVAVMKSKKDLAKGFDAPSIVEEFVDFKKELSVIVARNASGKISVFPSIEMMFHPGANLVDYLVSPARISRAVEKKAEAIAINVARRLNIVGLAAVEMFVTKSGKVLVNEIAPRPHNSGHHTIEANVTSQYEQHLRAIFNLPFGSTDVKSPAVMVNILGEEGYEGIARYAGLEKVLGIEGSTIHLYGKEKTKPFRKMGHVTIIGKNVNSILKLAKKVKKTIKVIV
jgi:5-(carboxyamino)imidazole ribonucleotide synthase